MCFRSNAGRDECEKFGEQPLHNCRCARCLPARQNTEPRRSDERTFSTFGIDPEQDVKQQAQKIASQLSPGACAEVLENCLKFLGDIRFSAENSKAVNDSSADHLSAHSDCSATQSVP